MHPLLPSHSEILLSLHALNPVGTFNQTPATEYCLSVKNVVLLDLPFDEENME